MKNGRSLQELAGELERQLKTKADYVADTRSLCLNSERGIIQIQNFDGEGGVIEHQVTEHANYQISNWAGIPWKYYQRMLDAAPGLLDRNVHEWFQNKPARRKVRTLDEKARAFVSDRFKCVDNYDLMEQILPFLLAQKGNISIESCDVTERKMYLKAFFNNVERPIKGSARGDVVRAGFQIRNSEIGTGGYEVIPMLMVLACTNGMTVNKSAFRGRHFGRKAEQDGIQYCDETIQQEIKAIQMKVTDTVQALADPEKFDAIVRVAEQSTEKHIEGDAIKAMEVVTERFDLSERESRGVLTELLKAGDNSLWGLSNAITQFSQEEDVTYDRASDLEQLGVDILEVPDNEWEVIANAQ